jgi:pimeloyl-ACP methyl ester carboxylesterase
VPDCYVHAHGSDEHPAASATNVTEVQTHTVPTPDGRELCVESVGPAGAPAVLVHTGTPNSRRLFGGWIEDATSRGIQLISYDRPGYGGSSPHPGHTVADGAEDVRSIARALGIERLAVWGTSGGGPYALACAALAPDLVAAAGVVGSIAPWGAEGLDYFDGMGQDNVDEIKLYFSDPERSRQRGMQQREEMLELKPEHLIGAHETLLSPVDAAVLTGEFAQWLVAGLQDGLGATEQGWWDDGVAHMAPWGFELESIQIPVKVWHGRHDRFVPFQHGQWLAAHIPGAESGLSESDGHLTIAVGRVGEVHAWLLAHLQPSSGS